MMNINQLIELYAQTPTHFANIFSATIAAKSASPIRNRNPKMNYFLCPLQGQAKISIQHTQYAAKPNHILHIGPHTECHIDVTTNEAFHYVVLSYEVLRDENVLQHHFCHEIDDVARCSQLLTHMLKLAETPGSYARLQSQTLFMQFVEAFLTSAKRVKMTPRSEIVSFAVAYMHEHYAKDLSIAQLAERVGIERRRFSELFEATTGMNPSEYLMELRIRKAKEQLRTCDCSVAEVGENVGYYDCFYFSRVFKKCTGLSPSIYRKEYKALVIR